MTPPDPVDRDDWIQVAEVGHVWQGELIAGRLREAGIEAQVIDQTFRQEPMPNVRSFAVVRVLVPKGQEEESKAVLAQPVELPEDAELADGGEGEVE
jgi:hypothetical protein